MFDKTEKEIMSTWKGDISSPLVSVRCLAYNHAPYIEQALSRMLMQETKFPFEIVVHDDCSTDSTADIISSYAKEYPNIIKPILEKHNVYSTPGGVIAVKNMLCDNSKGKYYALCEGDDYWTDSLKLQKQYDILESNPNIMVCTTKTYIDSSLASKAFPDKYIPLRGFPVQESRFIDDKELASLVFGNYGNPFHASSFMCRREMEYHREYDSLLAYTEGDELMTRLTIDLGGVYYLSENMGTYRWIDHEGWTGSYMKLSPEEKYRHAKRQTVANSLFDDITQGRYHSLIVNANCKILEKWRGVIDDSTLEEDLSQIRGGNE